MYPTKTEIRQMKKIKDYRRISICQEITVEGFPAFTGGLIGYFAYEYFKYAEPKMKELLQCENNFDDMELLLFHDIIVFDHRKGKIILITGISLEELEREYEEGRQRIERMEHLLRHGEKQEFESFTLSEELKSSHTKEEV